MALNLNTEVMPKYIHNHDCIFVLLSRRSGFVVDKEKNRAKIRQAEMDLGGVSRSSTVVLTRAPPSRFPPIFAKFLAHVLPPAAPQSR